MIETFLTIPIPNWFSVLLLVALIGMLIYILKYKMNTETQRRLYETK